MGNNNDNEMPDENSNSSFSPGISEYSPGVGAALSLGWERMKANFLIFFLAVLILGIVEAPTQDHNNYQNYAETVIDADQEEDATPNSVSQTTEQGPTYGFLMFAYTFLFVPVISYGADLIFLQGVRGDKVEIKNIIAGFRNYLNVILSSILALGLVLIGFIMLIIPGIYIGCRLMFVSYLIMDEDLDPIEAVEGSWRMTRGHFWEIFLLAFISIFIMIFGLLLLIVGIIPAYMWVKSSFAALYLSIVEEGPLPQ